MIYYKQESYDIIGAAMHVYIILLDMAFLKQYIKKH